MKNSTLVILLIIALAGDIILAYELYECNSGKEVTQNNASSCTEILTVEKNIVMDSWNNFNALNNTSDQNWGAVCRDAFMRIFSDTSVNAVSFYLGADSKDPNKPHLYSVGLVGCKVIPSEDPNHGQVITKDDAIYYTCTPWCPPNCYTRSN